MRAPRRPAQAQADETLDFETTKGVKVVTKFDDMGLKQDLIRGIYAFGEPLLYHVARCHQSFAAAFGVCIPPPRRPPPPAGCRVAFTRRPLTRPWHA